MLFDVPLWLPLSVSRFNDYIVPSPTKEAVVEDEQWDFTATASDHTDSDEVKFTSFIQLYWTSSFLPAQDSFFFSTISTLTDEAGSPSFN